MSPNASPAPRIWTDEELARDAQRSLDDFVDRRLAEPSGHYALHVAARRRALFRLFRALAGIDPGSPDIASVRAVLLDSELFDALRYVAGPPVSEDDLGVLVTRGVSGISRTGLATDDKLPGTVLALICRLADPFRFPWIASRRKPSGREMRRAIEATTGLHAVQSLQTERRGYGKQVERRLQVRLSELGFVKITGRNVRSGDSVPFPVYPPRGRITQPSHHPVFPHFYGECTVYGRKVDLFIALLTGRMIALEAKDSSSALNSTKRLLNDTAAKAKHYRDAGGRNIISAALLSGVFKLADLKAAQEAGLYLVWAHAMDDFVDWIRSQG